MGVEKYMRIESLVSVVVAVSKKDDNIYGCVECIMEQSYQNLEIILVYDATCERSKRICNNLSIMDMRIKIIGILQDKEKSSHEDFRTLAFYEGLLQAKGSYITFVDNRDRIRKDMIRYLLRTCTKYQCQISSLSRKSTNFGKGKIRVYRRNAAFLSRKFTSEFNGKLFDIDLFEDINLLELLEKEGGYGDNFILYRLYYRAKKAAIIDKQMYYEVKEKRNFFIDKQIQLNNGIQLFKDRINFFKDKERTLLDLSHEYYCMFLAAYYLYIARNKKEKDMEKVLASFKKEYDRVRSNIITPINRKIFLSLLYYLPGLCAGIARILAIDYSLLKKCVSRI